LDLIEEAKGEKPSGNKKINDSSKDTKPQFQIPTTIPKVATHSTITKAAATNAFAAELSDSDDDLDQAVYDPTVRDSANKRSTVSSEDLSKRKSALFGLSNPSPNLATKSQLSDSGLQGLQTGLKAQQRPQTTEAKMTRDEDEIGEINIGFSRRGGKTAVTKERPFTSPGNMGNVKPVTEAKIAGDIEEDDDDDVPSEYLSTVLSRDRKDAKKPTTNLKFASSSGTGTAKISSPTNAGDSTTPKKSPRSEFVTSKEGFYANKEVTISQLIEEKKDGGNFSRNPVGILGKKELQEPQNQQGQAKSVASIGNPLLRNRIDGHGHTVSSQLSGGSGFGEGSLKDGHGIVLDIGKDGTLQGYMREVEEHYKRRSKEAEEYFENRYKQLKNSLEEEKRKWDEIHEKEVKLLKKENEEIRESMNKQMERERERMKEMFNLELESKDKVHKYELERQRHIFEDENDSLKKQLEAQAKLNSLADEIKESSNKLFSISNKIETDKGSGSFGVKGELRQKEKKLEDLERKLLHELEIVNNEKKRIDRMREELETRETEDRQELQKEKEHIRQEFARLTELQEALRRQELEKMRSLEKEKVRFEHEREKLEKESIRLKEEYNKRYHDLEVQVELYELRTREFEKVMEITEASFRQKQEQMEISMRRLVAVETDLIAKVRELEHKEILINKDASEVQSRLNILELERISFEKERGQVLKLADQAREDGEKLRKFRLDFENEQYKNVKLRTELAGLASNLRHEKSKINEEKSNIALMQRTLDSLKHDFVKEVDLGVHKPFNADFRPTATFQENRERSQEGPIARAYNTFSGSAWNSPNKASQKQEVPGERNRMSVREDSRFLKLKNLRGESLGRMEDKETKTGGAIKIISNSETIPQSKLKKTWQKNAINVENPPKEIKTPILDSFHYGSYMRQLQAYDKVSNSNQSYLTTEKEELSKSQSKARQPSPLREHYAIDLRRKSGGFHNF